MSDHVRGQDVLAAGAPEPDRRPRLLAGVGAAVLSAVPVVVLALAVRDASAPLVRFDERVIASTTSFALRHDAVGVAAEVGGYLLHPWLYRIAVLVAAFVLWRRHARSAALWAASTMVGGTLLGAGLKLLVSRARPLLDEPLHVASGYSFPSGHALNASLGVTLLLVLLWRPLGDRGHRGLALGIGLLLVLLTGLDRLLLGVHFPTDVTAGWAIGALVVLASWIAFGPTLRERARLGTEQAVEAGASSSDSDRTTTDTTNTTARRTS